MRAYNAEYAKKYTETHKEEKRVYDKARNIKNREKNKRYCHLHKTQRALASKKYREKNKDKIRIERNIRAKKLWGKSPVFRLNGCMSVAIRSSLNGQKKGKCWFDLVGYTCNGLRKHLEKQFIKGMTWENYGEWHIDHKIPKSVFNFAKPEHEDFKKCWALKNLQPLWAKDNKIKKDKLIKHFQPSLLI